MSHWLYGKNKKGKPVLSINSSPYFHSGIKARVWVSLISSAIACLMLTTIVAGIFGISTFSVQFKVIAVVILIIMFVLFYRFFHPKKTGNNQQLKRDEETTGASE